MMTAIFVVTALFTLMNVIKFLGLMLGNDMNLPPILAFGKGDHAFRLYPDTWFIFYPVVIYQTGFWLGKLQIV